MTTSADVIAALDARHGAPGTRDDADSSSTHERSALRMRDLFDIAKAHRDLTLDEVDALLGHPTHEARLAAVCILDFKARRARSREDTARSTSCTSAATIASTPGTWSTGPHRGWSAATSPATASRPSSRSPPRQCRSNGATAITAPLYFVKAGTDSDLSSAFELADLLANDPEPVVHNAVGIFVKHAGRRDPVARRAFLDAHAATMPRAGLRLAILKLEPDEGRRYLDARRMDSVPAAPRLRQGTAAPWRRKP